VEPDRQPPAASGSRRGGFLGGKLYVAGGWDVNGNVLSTAYAYDPVGNTWSQVASYPQQVAFLACAGISGEIVCSGGYDVLHNQVTASTYIYDPHTNVWSQGASMPLPLWGMSYTGSGNQLQTANGFYPEEFGGVVHFAYDYDPRASAVSLPSGSGGRDLARQQDRCTSHPVTGRLRPMTAATSGPLNGWACLRTGC
jgi:N-acetylneuraminic acid mutarotase